MISSKTANKEEIFIKAHELEGRTWYKDYLLIFAIVALIIIFSVINPQFLGINNIFSVLRYGSVMGLIACGISINIILGGFDLSAAAIANFAGVVSIRLLLMGYTSTPIIWVVSILVAMLLTYINSVFIVRVKVPAFIATLGMSTFLTGAARGLTGGGVPTYPNVFPSAFLVLGKCDLINVIPVSVLVLLAAVVLMYLVENSPFGRKMYASGSNPLVAIHVGIEVEKIKTYGFLIAGFLYGVAGITLCSNVGYCSSDLAAGYQFPALMSVLLGMSFLSTKFANIRGTMVAVVLLSLMVNGFTMINLPFFLRDIIQGIILIFAIGIVGATGAPKKK